MAAKRKQQNKAVEQKPPNSVDLADAGVPSSARRSRRLRGVEVEFNANVLDEIERERRSSRSRSRSATPSFDRSSKFEQSVGQAKFPDAGPSKPSANSSTNHNNASPQRARINFEQDDSIIGDKDAMESGDNDEEEGDEKEQETEEKGKNEEMDEEGVKLGEKAEQKDEKLERFAGQKKDGKETDTDGSEEEDEDDEEEQEKDEEEDEMSEEGIQFGEEEAQNQRQNKGKKREQYNEQKKGRGTENDGREEEKGQDEEEEEVKDEEDEEEEEQDNCEEIGQEGVQFARKQKNRRGTENDGREEEEGQDEEEEGQDEEDDEEEEEENYEEIGEEGVQFARKQKGKKLEQFNGHKTNGREEEDEDEEEEGKEQQEGDESGYEEDIEDPKAVQQRRGKLPKSALDDKFFNLAEMNAFLETEDKKEDEKARRKNDRNLGQIENADEIEQMISAYEQTNLQQREWALLGEAKAEERPKDALLEQFVDADYRMLAPPTIDAEKTAQLEAIIIKRIKDGLFDDVVRKVRINESLQSAASYRNATVVGKTEQKVRKSLAEVYGDKYSATINETEEFGGEGTKDGQPKFDPAVEAIKKDLDTLFLKLDALSHFQFRPQPIQEEVKILNNMPSLHMEEVGPQAAVGPEVNLLAPEEVTRRVKGAPKAADERTETDRKRQRRRKKKKQSILASIGAMNGEGIGDGEAAERVKKKKIRRSKMDFADQIQKLMQNGGQKRKRKELGENVEEKARKKKKRIIGKEKE